MAQQTINIGSTANDGTGDPLRTAFDKINDNFNELYGTTAEANDLIEDTSPQLGGNLDVNGQRIVTVRSNEDIVLDAAGTGEVVMEGDTRVKGDLYAEGRIYLGDDAADITQITGKLEVDSLEFDGATITGLVTNGDITITPEGTGNVVLSKETTIAEQLTVDSNIRIRDNVIEATASNSDIVINAAGTGNVVAGAIRIANSTISSDDSTLVTIADGVRITGNSEMQGTASVTGATTLSSTLAVTGAVTLSDTLSVSGATTMVGNTTIDNIIINDSTISTASNADLNLQPGGTGNIVAGAVTINGTTFSSTDSTKITLAENVDVTGTLTTANISTVGTQTINGTLNVDFITIKDNEITSNASDSDINITASGTGSVVINSPISLPNNQDVSITGSLAVDNITVNGNTISSTTGGITLTAAAGQTVTSSSLFTAGEIQATLIEGTTIRTDKIQSDTSNGDILIDTQGTGVLDIRTATQSSVGSAGGASALPATPTGYIEVKVGGTAYVIPYYAKS
jgi:hypothetical protein